MGRIAKPSWRPSGWPYEPVCLGPVGTPVPLQLLTGDVPLATILGMLATVQLQAVADTGSVHAAADRGSVQAEADRGLVQVPPTPSALGLQCHNQVQNTSAIPWTRVFPPKNRVRRR